MLDPQAPLRDFRKKHDFLVVVDSDGSAFDTMEVKTKECFVPSTIECWGLQRIAEPVCQATMFVHVHSRWRGIHRWHGLVKVFELLRDWPQPVPDPAPLREWLARAATLSIPTLQAEIDQTGDPFLEKSRLWSERINACVEKRVCGLPPFPMVRESLEHIAGRADILVSSVTQGACLVRDWQAHGLDRYATLIAGQEMGIKRDHIRLASAGRYGPNRVLMIGDAPADVQVARESGIRFFPIKPGLEGPSWELFCRQVADKFINSQYSQEEEAELIGQFDKLLPETPPWKN